MAGASQSTISRIVAGSLTGLRGNRTDSSLGRAISEANKKTRVFERWRLPHIVGATDGTQVRTQIQSWNDDNNAN